MATTIQLGRPARRTWANLQLIVLGLLSFGFTAEASSLISPAGDAGQPVAGTQSSGPPPSEPAYAPASTLSPIVEEPVAGPSAGPPRLAEIVASYASTRIDPVLVGAGDIADCETGADMATAHLIEGIPGLVFTAGDEAYPAGSEEDFRNCYQPSWGRFLDRTLPAVGNHEYGTAGAAGYFGFFGDRAGGPGRPWYSLDLGTWHLVVLDSNCEIVGCGPGSAQLTWLKADLAAHPAPCTLAIWHHPRFSSGSHGNDTAVRSYWRALMAAGAEIVVNGHDHDYERFAPQTPRGRLDPTTGIRQLVVGTGGARLYRFQRIRPNSRVRLTTHGVLKLTLHAGSYSWQFLRTDGSIGDAGRTDCH
jgi:hypothetical protein